MPQMDANRNSDFKNMIRPKAVLELELCDNRHNFWHQNNLWITQPWPSFCIGNEIEVSWRFLDKFSEFIELAQNDSAPFSFSE